MPCQTRVAGVQRRAAKLILLPGWCLSDQKGKTTAVMVVNHKLAESGMWHCFECVECDLCCTRTHGSIAHGLAWPHQMWLILKLNQIHSSDASCDCIWLDSLTLLREKHVVLFFLKADMSAVCWMMFITKERVTFGQSLFVVCLFVFLFCLFVCLFVVPRSHFKEYFCKMACSQ